MIIYIDEIKVRKIQIISVTLGILMIGIFFMTNSYSPESPFWIPLKRSLNTGLALSILIMMGPQALVEWNNNKFIKKVEERLPIFLRDITNEVQAGVPLMLAIENASLKDYGPINIPLRIAINRINVTSDIENSLLDFGRELITPQAMRLSYILIEAYGTGGSVVEILETSRDIFNKITKHRSERKNLVNPYLYVVFLGNFVFLIISWVLLKKFLGSMLESLLDINVQSSGLFSTDFNLNYYWSILFWAAIIESIVGGLIGGKIKYGMLRNGLIYSCILILITMIFFNSPLF
ncbi:type II secretion system F family protein [Thermoproteota archaeon]